MALPTFLSELKVFTALNLSFPEVTLLATVTFDVATTISKVPDPPELQFTKYVVVDVGENVAVVPVRLDGPPNHVWVPLQPLAVMVMDVPGQMAGFSGVMVMKFCPLQLLPCPMVILTSALKHPLSLSQRPL